MAGRSKEETQGVTLLGNQGTKYPDNYAPEVFETFVNKHPDNDYFVKFNCPEFTSLRLLGIADNAPGIIKTIDHRQCFLK